MRYSCILAMALLGTAWALPSQDVQKQLDQKVEDIDSRRGIQVNGAIKSVFLRSGFSSPQDINAYDRTPDTEREGFSQFDLKLGFRSQEQTRANVVIRMTAGYQDFFNAGAKNVSIPWMSLEGIVADHLFWAVGDFRQEYSALSLSSPDINMIYEPEIFRRDRAMARSEVFLEGSQRNLQGANVQFRNDFGGIFGGLRAEGLFSRLRRVEVLDFSGATGNILPNEETMPGASQSSGMDKLLYGGNFEWLPVSQNTVIGVTPLFIKDLKTSTTSVYRQLDDGTYEQQSVNPGVLLPENSSVISLRAGTDVARIMGDSSLILDVLAEYASSKDQSYEYDLNDSLRSKDFTGSAILAELNVGYRNKGSWIVSVNANLLMNDSSWYNPLAQSPSFFARRVANSDKDGNTVKYGTLSPMYSTFDALYHFNPKFSPMGKGMNADPLVSDQTNSYNIAPYAQNSWGTAVYTRDELTLVNALNDSYVVTGLPNGLATANRVGPRATMTAGFGANNALEAQLLFSMLSEVSPTAADKAKFSEIGGGLRLDIGALAGWKLPLEVSGSYRTAGRKQGDLEQTSDFINGGVFAKLHKRFGLSAGVQSINSETKNEVYALYGLPTKSKQMQWMTGIDYSLSKNAWLAINFGQITVTNTYVAAQPFVAADGTLSDDTSFLPSYITADMLKYPDNYKVKTQIEHSFSVTLTEATVNVDF